MKNVLITGGSRGIGKGCVYEFAKAGYRVFLNYEKSDDAAQKICAETGAIAVKADVSDEESVERMAELVRKYGRVSVIVNNAGISQIKLFSDITAADWDRMFDVNVRGMFLVVKAFLPDMIREKYGKIINISSMWGVRGGSCEVHYSAAKAAVIGFTKALAKEVGPSGINVNCIAPGVIDTDMNSELDEQAMAELCADTPVGRIGTPYDIAKAAVFLASDDASFITGQTICADGGIIA